MSDASLSAAGVLFVVDFTVELGGLSLFVGSLTLGIGPRRAA